MNENELYVVKKYKFDNLLIIQIDSIKYSCFIDCYNKNYHIFVCKCDFDFQFTNIRNNEIFNITISDKIKNLCELKKKVTVARRNGFKFNQINKLTNKVYSHLRYINISYHLKFQILICHRQFFRKFLKIENI